MTKAILIIIFQILFVIPAIWVCKWFYKLLGLGFYVGTYLVYHFGKFMLKPEEFQMFMNMNMKMTKMISEFLGFILVVFTILSTIYFIKYAII